MKPITHKIDAAGKVIGRLAVEVAMLLRGKDKADFVLYKDMGDYVMIKNIDKVKFTGKKLNQKKYFRHSEYLGHLKEIPLNEFFAKRPEEVFKIAVYGMLPKNRLRAKMIKRLRFEK
jgi:large subunit ribosomal protein L13